MRAEFCIFESNAPGLKANFYKPYVDMPSWLRLRHVCAVVSIFLTRVVAIVAFTAIAVEPQRLEKQASLYDGSRFVAASFIDTQVDPITIH